ncbi:uncharacterized protein SPSK_05662 [Sporothrix schenckii 1099-18]|uniref:Uncharacterized protein n=1 Tax=Sporothrix schenckii 1099-18 TaxID=1397361 RepID=A0A0F2LSX9_SPOSC|nr:uncharacterized protein SPSK_05662 [Sporothrix schenckii 1099-18]KJR80582.1 hypothetical protein SPSK_05662 [Sporothrix schenckii 1099-18]
MSGRYSVEDTDYEEAKKEQKTSQCDTKGKMHTRIATEYGVRSGLASRGKHDRGQNDPGKNDGHEQYALRSAPEDLVPSFQADLGVLYNKRSGWVYRMSHLKRYRLGPLECVAFKVAHLFENTEGAPFVGRFLCRTIIS